MRHRPNIDQIIGSLIIAILLTWWALAIAATKWLWMTG